MPLPPSSATSTSPEVFKIPIFLLLLLCSCYCVHASELPNTCGEISVHQQQQIVNRHNYYRSRVAPFASNMRKMYWNKELATQAQSYAEECRVEHNEQRHGQHPPDNHGRLLNDDLGRIGENIQVLTECDGEMDYSRVVEEWYEESHFYDFTKAECNPLCTCDRYLQVVWAHTTEVGCGIAHCPDPEGYTENNVYLMVCNYSPGPPTDFVTKQPYKLGAPCSDCGKDYPYCHTTYQQEGFHLCEYIHVYIDVNEVMYMGSDPHFGIRLPDDSLLCYSFQGEHNSSFNIISNSQLEMNALFVPDSQRENNTWIGSIGITLYHDGEKTTTLKFTAADKVIHVGSRVELDAMTVHSISFNKGKLSIVESPRHHTPRYPSVRVDFVDSELSFTVSFIKNNHLDLAWHSSGEPYMNSRGVVGQFFRDGVRIDQENQLLYIPRRSPIPVIKRPLWDFMKQQIANETECWTSVLPSNQGVGLINGQWRDYKVDSLLSVGH